MATDLSSQVIGIKDDYKYGFRDSDDHYAFKSGKGLNREVVHRLSEMKSDGLPVLRRRDPIDTGAHGGTWPRRRRTGG